LYLANLSKRVTDRDLEEVFEKFGKIRKTQVVIDPISRESRCFGFIIFDSKEAAEDAVAQMNRTTFFGKDLIVEKSRRMKPREATPGHYMGKQRRYPSVYDRRDRSRSGGRRGFRRSRSRSYEDRRRGDFRRRDRTRSRSYSPPMQRQRRSHSRDFKQEQPSAHHDFRGGSRRDGSPRDRRYRDEAAGRPFYAERVKNEGRFRDEGG